MVVLGNSVRVLEEDLEVKGRFGWVNGLNRKRGLNSKCTTLKARRLRMVVLCKNYEIRKAIEKLIVVGLLSWLVEDKKMPARSCTTATPFLQAKETLFRLPSGEGHSIAEASVPR